MTAEQVTVHVAPTPQPVEHIDGIPVYHGSRWQHPPATVYTNDNDVWKLHRDLGLFIETTELDGRPA